MNTRELTLAEIGLIASTRGMLGAGIGLLLAGRLTHEQRRPVGCTLLMVGFLTTIPLVACVIGRSEKRKSRQDQASSESLAKAGGQKHFGGVFEPMEKRPTERALKSIS